MKLLVLAAMLAMVVVFVVPAVAQDEGTANNCPAFIINPAGTIAQAANNGATNSIPLTPTCTDTDTSGQQEFSQSSFESGDIKPQSDIRVNGNDNRVDPAVQQSGNNTGNIGNEQGNEPVNSTQDDVDFTGNSFESSPSLTGSSS